jgi:hypothetical protein
MNGLYHGEIGWREAELTGHGKKCAFGLGEPGK